MEQTPNPNTVQLFRAAQDTKRFRANQKVFICDGSRPGSHYRIKFKWRGKGRWVKGIIGVWRSSYSKLNPQIGKIQTIDVTPEFKAFINL